jgi:hypothetical protein
VSFYKQHKTASQFSNLNLSSFHDPKAKQKHFPKLKGKGSEIKCFLFAMQHVWGQFSRAAVQEDQWAQELLNAMCRVQVIISDASDSLFLAPGEVKSLRTSTDEVLRYYTRLGNAADRRGDFLFSQVPKLHWAWHLAWFSQDLSPRRGACYMDEDFVRHLKLITQRCTSGTPLNAIPNMVALKYRWGMHIASSEVCK